MREKDCTYPCFCVSDSFRRVLPSCYFTYEQCDTAIVKQL